MKIKENKKVLIIAIIILFLLIVGGTLAYWFWEVDEENETHFTLEVQGATLTINGGNVTKEGMYPTADCGGDAALIGDVATVTAVNATNSDMDVIIRIRASLSVKQGILNTEKKDKINWAIVDTSDGTTCSTTPYKGTMGSVTTNIDLDTGIKVIASKNTTTVKNYQIYVWLDSTYVHINEGDVITDPMQNIGISVKFSQASELIQKANPNAPVLDDGMIPITISADGVATIVSESDSSWYDYGNKQWANAVLVKENGTKTRDYYKSNTGVTVAEDDILAYYVWIPRYKYKIWTLTNSATGKEQTIDIVFEGASAQVTQGSAVGDYITHPAFIWDGNPIAGLWVGKFETGHSTLSSSTTNNNLGCVNENCVNADGLIVKPNVNALRYNNISNFFYASRSMTRSGNPFGLSLSEIDSHMMKNSEWGAVAYLSHSIYGLNNEIYSNNSSSRYTGRSGGNVGGMVNPVSTQFSDQTSTYVYNTYGYYTWIGEAISSNGIIGSINDRTLGTKASTTGNVSGIYDMVGGSWEYVMGLYSGENSSYILDSLNKAGFSTLLESKYFDEYTSNSVLTACNGGPCYGHALSETARWYNDTYGYVTASNPWFERGGGDISNVGAGIFQFNNGSSGSHYGNAGIPISWRLVLIV